MTFDSRSIQHLRELGRQLPKELPEPNPKNNPKNTKNKKCHPIETEENPQVLFQELMNASPDGNVPSHLIERLRGIEQKERNQNNSLKNIPSKDLTSQPTKKQQPRKESEEDILYTLFDRFLLEDED